MIWVGDGAKANPLQAGWEWTLLSESWILLTFLDDLTNSI